MQVEVLPRKRPFGALSACHLKLQRSQLLLPFGIGLVHLLKADWSDPFPRVAVLNDLHHIFVV